MCASTPAGSAKCSNESSETIEIDGIAPFARERAAIGDAARGGVLDAEVEPPLAQIDADDVAAPCSAISTHFAAGTAAEVEHVLVARVIPDPRSEQHFQLAASDVGRRDVTALDGAVATSPN